MFLDGMPFVRWHIDQLQKLPIPWQWHIVEGLADLKTGIHRITYTAVRSITRLKGQRFAGLTLASRRYSPHPKRARILQLHNKSA
jgi:hypothetical protein